MKRNQILPALLLIALVAGSGFVLYKRQSEAAPSGNSTGSYSKLSQEEAKQQLDTDKEIVLLDVREADEYAAGYIPGARLFPLGTISADTAAAAIPASDSKVFVYCRSGRRSEQAAEKLAALGYTQVYDIGGVMSWPYELVKP